jgi:hypothetical protein
VQKTFEFRHDKCDVCSWNLDSLMPGYAILAERTQLSNVDAIFVACNVTGDFHDTAGVPYSYRRSWENATFAGAALPTAVNGHTLLSDVSLLFPTGEKASKVNFDNGSVWKEDSENYWMAPVITGGSPYSSFTVGGTMPDFTGVLPSAHDTATDFHLTFDPTTPLMQILLLLCFTFPDGGHSVKLSACAVEQQR